MVNERQGKVYNPRPVYNRKLLRSVIRAGVQKQFGQHHVSANMAGVSYRITCNNGNQRTLINP